VAGMDWSAQRGAGPAGYEEFLVPAMFAPFAKRIVKYAGVRAGARVLDLACGTGVVARAAAHLAGPEGSVTGVDLGEPTLALARSRGSEEGAAAIDYVQADAGALPFTDDGFDVGICQQGLQFFPDRVGALVQLRRVLAPGASVAVATWLGIEHSPFRFIADALSRHIGVDAARMMHAPYSLHDGAELAALLSGAGFSDIEVFEEAISCTWASHSQFASRSIAATPIAALFDEASEQARHAVTEEVTASLAEYALEEDRLCMTMATNIATARA
jgi:ubiquinone/menaquinone biosynthesis C-methylase UbiE